jgi:predicted RNA-binding Zn-ribbon protein involved in translation (DUF1610 family)
MIRVSSEPTPTPDNDWEKTDYFCPHCGSQEVYDDGDSDYYYPWYIRPVGVRDTTQYCACCGEQYSIMERSK